MNPLTPAEYDRAWEQLEAEGASVHGEADFVASFQPKSVLDAGCGTGRVAIELSRRGIKATGVEIRLNMLDYARTKSPDVDWIHGDLSSVQLDQAFDAVVMAGNVMIFVEPGTQQAVVNNMAGHLNSGGRLIAGFALDKSLDLDSYDAMASNASLKFAQRWATWEQEPFTGGKYAVSVHTKE